MSVIMDVQAPGALGASRLRTVPARTQHLLVLLQGEYIFRDESPALLPGRVATGEARFCCRGW